MKQAEFVTRTSCITCKSDELSQLSRGRYSDEPLRSFLANDPFGEDPLPHLLEAEWCFVQCQSCGQKFHQKILSPEWNKIYYDRWISSEAIEELGRARGIHGFHADFGKGKHATERVLQIELLTRKLRVEFSAAREKTKVIDFFGNLDQVKQEIEPAHFHAVVLFEVLEHLSEPLEVLQSIRPLVKDGGILVLETPNCPDVTSIENKYDYRLINPLGHINAFTPETQERIAKEAGFKRITPSISAWNLRHSASPTIWQGGGSAFAAAIRT